MKDYKFPLAKKITMSMTVFGSHHAVVGGTLFKKLGGNPDKALVINRYGYNFYRSELMEDQDILIASPGNPIAGVAMPIQEFLDWCQKIHELNISKKVVAEYIKSDFGRKYRITNKDTGQEELIIS
jgi:hypothetical protein